MGRMKKIIKGLVPTSIIEQVCSYPIYRYLDHYYLYKKVLKPNLQKTLYNKVENQRKECVKRERILVPLIETAHYAYYQVLLVAKALQLRGHDVKLLLCGESLDGCEIKSVRNTKVDPCLSCRFNSKNIIPFFGLETIYLHEYLAEDDHSLIRSYVDEVKFEALSKELFMGIDLSRMTADSIVRHYYGAVPDENDSSLSIIRKKYLTSAAKGVIVANKISQLWKPTIIFSHLDVYVDWQPYHVFFKSRNIRTTTISISTFNFHAQLLNYSELYSSNLRFNRWVNSRKETERLLPEERTQLMELLNLRKFGNAPAFERYKFFETGFAEEKLIIDQSKRNFFLFSNVFWDVGINNPESLYSDVITWVLDTIEIVKDDPDIHLYIKPHPAEKYDSPDSSSLKGVVDYINAHFPILPKNVTVIFPEWKINTYKIFPYIDFGIVYNGTLGIEMFLDNIKVISCARGPYSDLNLVIEPQNKNEYRDVLLNNSSSLRKLIIDKNKAELFAYFYFIKTLIPWSLTKQAYGDHFKGFTFNSINDIKADGNKYLDHICNCIVDPENNVIEDWD
jgi:hypothetical protein